MKEVQEESLDKNGEEASSIGRFRQYVGFMTKVITVIAIVWSLFQLYVNSFGTMENIKHRVWFFGFMAVLIFLLMPARKKEKRKRKLPTLWDCLFVIATFASVGYFLLEYDSFVVERGGMHIQPDYWFGGIGIIVAFEAARRAAGLPMTILAAIFLLYNFYGQYMPGPFQHLGFDYDRIIDSMWWGSNGMFGTVAGVAATYIFLFILFGAFLRRSGFTEFISNLALVVAGRSSGGPAKVAVIGSGMMGMVNGSGIANASTVGTFTIPMMKRTGYKAHFAGGVEAVSGTGGVLAPPIMGAASFVMASFLGIEYRVVILAALIPAILYFVMCFMSVHFEAKKQGLRGLAKEEIPKLKDTMKKGGHLLIPVIILVGMIVVGMTPLFAAIFSILAIVVVSWFKKETRMRLKDIGDALEEGARNVLVISAACMIVGIVVGTISLTSLGLVIGNNILDLAGGSILLAAVLTMVLTILLGTGVPVTASYIIAATISAPILADMGIPLLLSHMFVFYYAALSEITPPVALSAMVTSGIAGASFTRVSMTAVRLGIVGFILPYFFIYNPPLLFVDGSLLDSLIGGVTGVIGVIALAGSLSNWFYTKTHIIQRVLLAAAGIAMITPNHIINVVAFVGMLGVLFWQKKRSHSFVGKWI